MTLQQLQQHQSGGGLQAIIRFLVDVVIVLDATASMTPYIDALKRALTSFVDALDKAELDARFGLAVFWDELEGTMPQLCPVGTSPSEIKSILKKLSVTGGGDEPESALPALMKALAMPGYRPEARTLIFLCTDASCHDPEGQYTSDTVRQALEQRNALVHACCPEIEPYKTFCTLNGGGLLFPIRPEMATDAFAKIIPLLADRTRRTMAADAMARKTRLLTERMRTEIERETRLLS